MVCKGTDETEELQPENTKSLREVLVPKATVVTPNLFEAARLSQMAPIQSVDDMKEAAAKIHELGAQVRARQRWKQAGCRRHSVRREQV